MRHEQHMGPALSATLAASCRSVGQKEGQMRLIRDVYIFAQPAPFLLRRAVLFLLILSSRRYTDTLSSYSL